MSLERNSTLIDDKNPLDTSSSVNYLSSSILARGLEDIYSPDASIDMYSLRIPLDTQKSSQFSELYDSQGSCEYKLMKFVDNELKSFKNLEKSQENQGVGDSLQELSMKSFGGVSVDENLVVPGQVLRDSTVYTNLSSDSSHGYTEPMSPSVLEESKRGNLPEMQRSKAKMIGSRNGVSLRNSTFALTNKIHCNKCKTECFTNVSFQMKDMGLWGNIGFFFTAMKCCGEPRALSRYQDIVHSCKKCGSVLARISTA